MFPRLRPARSRDTLQLTPFLLVAILAAMVSTAALFSVWYADVHTVPQAGSSVNHANLIVAVGVAGVAWAAVVFAACRDVVMRRLDELAEQFGQAIGDVRQHVTLTAARLTDHLTDTAAELAEQAEASGVFRGIEMEARRPPARRRLQAVPGAADSAGEAR